MPSMGHMRSNSILELLSKAEDETESTSVSPPSQVSSPGARNLPSSSRRGGANISRGDGLPELSDSPQVRFAEDDLSMRSASSLNAEDMFPRLRRARSSMLASHSSLSLARSQTANASRPSIVRFTSPTETGEQPTEANEAIVTEKQKRKQRTKSTALLIELWLWMQFAVVIVVFLFAMARMGPRTFFRKSKANQRPTT